MNNLPNNTFYNNQGALINNNRLNNDTQIKLRLINKLEQEIINLKLRVEKLEQQLNKPKRQYKSRNKTTNDNTVI